MWPYWIFPDEYSAGSADSSEAVRYRREFESDLRERRRQWFRDRLDATWSLLCRMTSPPWGSRRCASGDAPA